MINHANSSNLYRSYYPHPSRELVSPVCGIFTRDITEYKCIVNCFEVSSNGFLSSQNHTTLSILHKFMKPNIKISQLKKTISALSLTASHQLFICHNDPTFLAPPYPYLWTGPGGLVRVLYCKIFVVQWGLQPDLGQCTCVF